MISDIKANHRISSFRRYLPQVLACSVKNLSLLNYGLVSSLTTVLIPALTGLNPANNPDEHLSMTKTEISWLASILSLSFVIGCLFNHFLDPLGRKKSMIVCNISFFLGWWSLYYSNSLWSIYVSSALLGISAGLIEAPVMNYIGELSEPKIRTFLLATASLTIESGSVFIYFLSNHMSRRDVARICAVFPIIGAVGMLFVPETPLWLLSHNRPADALKSLQWFRGWTEPTDVRIEFENLRRYGVACNACYECEKRKIECNHAPPKFIERFRDFLRRKTIIPFSITVCLCLSGLFCWIVFLPYFVPILNFYKSPIDPNEVLVWSAYVGLIANIIYFIVIRSIGKRIVYLISSGLSILTIYALGIYGFFYLNRTDDSLRHYFPIFGFLFIKFLFNLSVRPLVSSLLSEIFSYRSKSLGSGLTLAICSIVASIFGKWFYILQAAITLPGQCLLFASFGTLAFVAMYFMLPETEGRTLEDIEMYFSDQNRKFFDIHIPKLSDQKSSITKH